MRSWSLSPPYTLVMAGACPPAAAGAAVEAVVGWMDGSGCGRRAASDSNKGPTHTHTLLHTHTHTKDDDTYRPAPRPSTPGGPRPAGRCSLRASSLRDPCVRVALIESGGMDRWLVDQCVSARIEAHCRRSTRSGLRPLPSPVPPSRCREQVDPAAPSHAHQSTRIESNGRCLHVPCGQPRASVPNARRVQYVSSDRMMIQRQAVEACLAGANLAPATTNGGRSTPAQPEPFNQFRAHRRHPIDAAITLWRPKWR